MKPNKIIPALKVVFLGWMVLSLSYADESRKPGAKLTDLAALSVQDRSITKLKSILQQYRGTQREAEILIRLADLYLERSGISFRISEGGATQKTHLYRASLLEGVSTLNEFIKKYPYHASIPMAYFKRARSHKELQDKSRSKADLLWLDEHGSNFEYIDAVWMDLADYHQEANEHQDALIFLSKIEKMPGSEYFPIALHKSAWSHFNLSQLQTAHDFLKREIAFYFKSIKEKGSNAAAENAMLEGAFNDLALFYFEAINKKATFASADKAIQILEKADETKDRKYFGSALLRFTRLLKAYALSTEMNRVKKIMIEDYRSIPQTAEVAMLVFQFHAERREYNLLPPALADLNRVRKNMNSKELDQKVEAAVSGALADLHKLVIKNKLATDRASLYRPLISLTESVSELLGQDNSTSLLANYSLAETSFELGEYVRATEKYADLLQEHYAKTLQSKKISRASLALRLLSSRYRELKKDQLIPEKLKIRPLHSKASAAAKDQLQKMDQWIVWVDQFSSELGPKAPVEDKQSYLAFGLEASKLIYEYRDQTQALQRLEKFAFEHADTDEGVTAVSIVLDTISQSEDPVRLYELTQRVLAKKSWKNKKIVEQVSEQSAQAHLKITLKTESLDEVVARSKECAHKFKDSKISMECQIIQAKTELKLGHPDRAEKHLTQTLTQIKDPAKIQSILLLRSDARNQLGKLDDSIADLFQYQNMTEFKDSDMTQAILQHAWFKRDHRQLDTLLKNSKVCSGKNAETCEQYRVVRILEASQSGLTYAQVFKNTLNADRTLSTVWSLNALQNPKKLPFQDRLVLLTRIGNSWEHLNPLLQVQLIPLLQDRVKQTLESIRISSPGVAPLTEDTTSIERRMRLTQEVDQAFAKVMKLPWLEIKLKGAEELGLIYERLVQDLRAIHTPEDLLKPFISKTKEIQTAVAQLQGMAMAYALSPKMQDKNQGGARATAAAVPANASPDQQLKGHLLGQEIENAIPKNLWTEWKNGVDQKRRDYLFYLVSLAEKSNPDFKLISPVVKGMVLIFGGAPTEAYELVKSAPETPFKLTVINQFQARKSP